MGRQLTSAKNYNGSTTYEEIQYSYRSDRTLYRITYADGTYDEFKAQQSKSADGCVLVADQYATHKDRAGNTWKAKFDNHGRVLWEEDPLGNKTEFTRNSTGFVTLLTYPNPGGGAPTRSYTYNSTVWDLSRIDYEDGSNEQISYDTTYALITSFIDRRGITTTNTLSGDKKTIVSSTTSVAGNGYSSVTTQFEYTTRVAGVVPGGLIKAIVDPRGIRTEFSYDSHGNLRYYKEAVGTSLASQIEFQYNSKDQMIKMIDELGRETVYTYDDLDRLTSVTSPDPDGTSGPLAASVVTYAYDRASKLTSVTDPLSRVTTYSYDTLGHLSTITTPARNGSSSATTTTVEYDLRDRIKKIIDPLGRFTQYAYDAVDRLLSTTLPDPDSGGSATSPVYSSTYDALGRTTSTTDARGNTTNYSFTNVWRTVTSTGPQVSVLNSGGATVNANPTDSVVRDANGNVTSVTDANGNVTSFTYDNLDRLITLTEADPDGVGGVSAPVTQFQYDKDGNLTAVIDPLNRKTEYVYDDKNRLIRKIDVDSDGNPSTFGDRLVTEYTYNAANELTQVELKTTVTASTYTSLGRIWTYQYDNMGRLIIVDAPDPDAGGPLGRPRTTYAYDAASRVTSVTDALNNTTTYAYDNHDNLVTVTLADPDGAGGASSPVTTYTYDDADQLLSVTDPMGRVTTYVYDNLGRLITMRAPNPSGGGGTGGPETTYTYDADGNLLTVTEADPDGAGGQTSSVTTYAYNALGWLTSVTDPRNAVTSYQYDAAGNLRKLTDPNSNATTWTYDALNRVTTETNQLGWNRNFTYDAVGNLTRRVDRNGKVIDYTYDGLNRRTKEEWRDSAGGGVTATTGFTYDVLSQLITTSDSDVNYSYTYDNLGRKTQEVADWATLPSSQTFTFDLAYNAMGSRTQVKAKLGTTKDYQNDYTYDNLQRLTSLTQQSQSGGNGVADKRVDFAYNAASQFTTISRFADLAGTLGVAATAYTYDGQGRLTNLAHTQGGTNLGTYAFTYDAIGRITQNAYTNSTSAWNETHDYTYDKADQLTDADHSSQTDEGYTYDANGNRTAVGAQNWTVGSNNRISTDGTYNYTYDDEGNLTQRTHISTGNYTVFEWDNRNQLVKVSEKNSSNVVTKWTSYAYDSFGRLVTKEVDVDGAGAGGVNDTFFVYDGTQIVMQLSRVGTSGAADQKNRFLWGPQTDQLLVDEAISTQGVAGTNRWTLGDHLGTIADIATYSSGTTSIANHRAYDSFGRLISESNSAVDEVFGYTGRLLDEDTGLQNNWHRWYDSRFGQWLSEDPVGFAAGDENLRRYVRNGVIGLLDPSGLHDIPFGNVTDEPPAPKPQVAKPWLPNGATAVSQTKPTSYSVTGNNGTFTVDISASGYTSPFKITYTPNATRRCPLLGLDGATIKFVQAVQYSKWEGGKWVPSHTNEPGTPDKNAHIAHTTPTYWRIDTADPTVTGYYGDAINLPSQYQGSDGMLGTSTAKPKPAVLLDAPGSNNGFPISEGRYAFRTAAVVTSGPCAGTIIDGVRFTLYFRNGRWYHSAPSHFDESSLLNSAINKWNSTSKIPLNINTR